jgi:hypothetical protein
MLGTKALGQQLSDLKSQHLNLHYLQLVKVKFLAPLGLTNCASLQFLPLSFLPTFLSKIQTLLLTKISWPVLMTLYFFRNLQMDPKEGTSYWKGRLSTVDLLKLTTSLNQLLSKLKILLTILTKTRYLNQEVNSTESCPFIRIPWFYNPALSNVCELGWLPLSCFIWLCIDLFQKCKKCIALKRYSI